MTELYLNYPTTEDYPTAMYYSAQYGTALLTTDTDVGASVFYFQPSRVTDMGNFANSLTRKYKWLLWFWNLGTAMLLCVLDCFSTRKLY